MTMKFCLHTIYKSKLKFATFYALPQVYNIY